ncbi:MAG: RHS repeat protein [Nannocystaceae bacterium]|nr:RHS repeat protein [Nannocystaceae bacterium]
MPAVVETRKDRQGNVIYERNISGHERRWTFDAAGHQTSQTDADGRTHRTQVVRWGLEGAHTDPLGHTTHFEHNPHQKITRVVDPGGSESRYVYDSNDRVVEVHRHGTLCERYVWDQAHRLIEKLDGKGRSLLQIEPHETGMPRRVDRLDGGFAEYDYDESGKTTTANTAAHSVRRRFRRDGKLALEDCDGNTVRHTYQTQGSSTTVVAGRFVLERRRDGDTVTLTDPSGAKTTLTTHADGSVHIVHGNGTREIQAFDAAGLLLGRSCKRSPGDSTADTWEVRHQYTSNGDLAGTHDTFHGNAQFEVDDAHRLVGVRTADGEVRFDFDAAGNLIKLPSVGTLQLDTGNRLAAAAAEQFVYDERHRVAKRVGIAGSEVRYHYDADGQLIRVEDDAGEAWSATYDGLGRRVTFGRGGRRTRLWWDEDRVAARQCHNGH